MIAKHAAANNLPLALVHRVVKRESDYNPRCIYAGNYGLMQIRLGTARSLGYTGTVEGLLDPDTNMTYAVRYLAGAYRVAGGDEDRAVALYASGYNSNDGHATCAPVAALCRSSGRVWYRAGDLSIAARRRTACRDGRRRQRHRLS